MTKKELQLNMVFTGLGLDQNTLAERTNIDRTAISRALSGRRKSPKVVEKITAVIAEEFQALVTEPETEIASA